MGLCNDCVYYTQRGTSPIDDIRNIVRIDGFKIGYCLYLTDSYGNPTRVDGGGSCDNFTERPTAQNGGYRGSGRDGSYCFLTSACVEYLGKSDDCEELTALRKFRDGYMKSTAEGKALVDEYYTVAPKIVERINSSGKQAEYYDYIYGVVKKCIDLINAGKNDSALDEYRTMVCRLSSELLNI